MKFAYKGFLAGCCFYIAEHVLTPSSLQRPGFATPGAKQHGSLPEPRKRQVAGRGQRLGFVSLGKAFGVRRLGLTWSSACIHNDQGYRPAPGRPSGGWSSIAMQPHRSDSLRIARTSLMPSEADCKAYERRVDGVDAVNQRTERGPGRRVALFGTFNLPPRVARTSARLLFLSSAC